MSDSVTAKDIYLVTSGDLRLAANQICWPAQQELEARLTQAFAEAGFSLRRSFPVDEQQQHGFISSQRMGMDVFLAIPPDAPLVFATAAWQYSHHVLAGLRSHSGPILTVANWSGQWPGLVGLLNLNGSLVKAGVRFSSLWSADFTDSFFKHALAEWLSTGTIVHDNSHVRPLELSSFPPDLVTFGHRLADDLRRRKAILGIFDEGCMGMYNAIIDDELLNRAGIYKERLSQSALVAKMRSVSDDEATAVYQWLLDHGLTFEFGPDPDLHLTRSQVQEQCRMYIAAVRMAAEFGCDAIGIQYQQGLKDLVPASDLAEGLLNNRERPPVLSEAGKLLFPDVPLPHFNEVDECAGVDALVTNRVWTAMGLDPSTTLHDVRWGEHFQSDSVDAFVWVFQISGAAPANHFIGGYAGARSERQPPMYFPLGGGSLKGVSHPGPLVWSRVFVEAGKLQADLGLGTAIELPVEETTRRLRETTSQWPIMHAVLSGVGRDQLMSRHRANHINVVYASTAEQAREGLAIKAAMLEGLGIEVHLCGNIGNA